MNLWPYMIPTLAAAPAALRNGKSLVSADMEVPSIGLYCAEESHATEPWLIGTFEPNHAWLEETGEFKWAFAARYVTGDGFSLRLPYYKSTLLDGDSVASIKDQPDLIYSPETRGRWSFKCRSCGLSSAYRSETLQSTASTFAVVGMKEISLSMLNSAVRRVVR